MRDRVDMAQLDHLGGQETERPAAPARGGTPARQGDQMGLLLAIEHPGTARDGPADEGPLEAAFDEVAADPVHGDRSDIQGQTDLFIGPGRPGSLQSAFRRTRARVNLRAAALPLATRASNCSRSSTDRRTMNLLFMLGLRPRILAGLPRLDDSPGNLSIAG